MYVARQFDVDRFGASSAVEFARAYEMLAASIPLWTLIWVLKMLVTRLWLNPVSPQLKSMILPHIYMIIRVHDMHAWSVLTTNYAENRKWEKLCLFTLPWHLIAILLKPFQSTAHDPDDGTSLRCDHVGHVDIHVHSYQYQLWTGLQLFVRILEIGLANPANLTKVLKEPERTCLAHHATMHPAHRTVGQKQVIRILWVKDCQTCATSQD